MTSRFLKIILWIMLGLGSTSATFWNENSDVVQLKADNFDETIKSSDSVLVAFYDPSSVACRNLKPEFESAAEVLSRKTPIFAAVDATVHKKIAEKYGVNGFPTVKFFKNGKAAYDVAVRDKESLVEFMLNPKAQEEVEMTEVDWYSPRNPVVLVGEKNLSSTVDLAEHALVLFYVDWCAHCRKAKPKFMKAAKFFVKTPDHQFFAINCAVEEDLCHKHFKAFWLPTFFYFRKGKKIMKYHDNHETDDFILFMMDAKNKMDYAEFWQWGSDVTVLDEDNFNKTLEEIPRSLVNFYTPWCQHCQETKDTFIEAAKLAKQSEGNVAFAVLDCVEYQVACNRRDIDTYPTLKVYEYKEPQFTYGGSSTAQGFLRSIKPWEWGDFVKILTKDDLDSNLNSHSKSLVMFYARWSDHSHKAKDAFKEAAKSAKASSEIMFGAIECDTQPNLCQEKEIERYPTFHLYEKKKLKLRSRFDQERTPDDFLKLLNDPKLKTEL